MKLAISNIAWQKNEDDQVYCLMEKYGFTGLEIAPGRIWENPLSQSQETIEKFKEQITQQGLSIIGMQGLLFGHPELRLFGNENIRKKTLTYLKQNILLASKLGLKALIFGSPKNRIVGETNRDKALTIASDFFYQLGEFAYQHQVYFCLEPNPKQYGTDFINTTEEARDLVRRVNSRGFCLHLDLGTMILNKEPIYQTVRKSFKDMVYCHLSLPYLSPITNKYLGKCQEFAAVLKKIDYNGWLSIEMKGLKNKSNIKIIKEALESISLLNE